MRRDVDLDFVRGIAILLALGVHFNSPTGIVVLDVLLAPGRNIGWAGVDLFFVLSGFLVGGLVFKEQLATGRFAPRRFLVRRAMKLWPILYVYLALLLVTGRADWRTFLVQTLLHVQNYWGTSIAHLWSLAVEEHFYLIFALGVTFWSGLRFDDTRLFVRMALVIFCACLALRGIAALAGASPVEIQWWSHDRFDSLAAGVLLAHLSLHRPAFFERLAARKWTLAAVALAAVAFIWLTPKETLLGETLGYTVAAAGAAAFLLLCYRDRYICRGRVPRVVARIGLYSYAIYIYQFVPYRILEAVEARLHWALPPAALVGLKYAGAIAAGALITKALERPFLALRDRIFPASGGARREQPSARLGDVGTPWYGETKTPDAARK